jgi:sulfate/thiosulfate transport system ATP-binding protein
MNITVENISKRFGTFNALKEISLDFPSGAFAALLGPSGSGKTTLLRIIAGLEVPDGGRVLFGGTDATEHSLKERRVGFVFQHYALFRHLTVYENVAFGLRVRPRATRPAEEEIQRRVMELLKLIQLDWLGDRYPSQLSGGQRQRVALARALAVEPKVLLLDEPFGSLDAKVRQELRRWLRRLHDEMHITSIFVTHDQEEALEVADRVVVMNAGRVEQVGTPAEVYHQPANPFVFNFLGNVNLFQGRVEEGVAYVGSMAMEMRDPEHPDAEKAIVYVRPHLFDVHHHPEGDRSFKATVIYVNPAGPVVKVEVTTEWGDPAQVELTQERYRALNLQKGDEVFLSPREFKVFAQEEKPDKP